MTQFWPDPPPPKCEISHFFFFQVRTSLISQPNFNVFSFCKKTPKCLRFASVLKHSPHFQLQFQKGPNLAAHFPTVHCPSCRSIYMLEIMVYSTSTKVSPVQYDVKSNFNYFEIFINTRITSKNQPIHSACVRH